MIEDLKKDTESRMSKTLQSLSQTLTKLRTGRAQPNLLEQINVPYYGSNVPMSQVANIAAEDSRTLTVTPWEDSLVKEIEKAIQNSDLGLNPVTAGKVIRVPLPDLTEERRKELAKLVKHEAEQSRVAIRNIRRDVISDLKSLLKEKDISSDEERRAEVEIQKLTDKFVKEIDRSSESKQAELMEF
ncbi:MAG: ribosome recycling factor [Pseudomonadota bacterium]|nr:ribosome recycling factor [Pseudomonadota bacterium]